MNLKVFLENKQGLKKFIHWILIPTNQARPRWWVSVFLNPFIHKRGKKAIIRRRVRMDVLPFNKFSIGDFSIIEDFSVVNNGLGEIKIGNRVTVGIGNVLIGPLVIGNNVIIAQNVVFSALNHGYEDVNVPIVDQKCNVKIINIGEDSWIGANSVITAGVKIGKHSVVAGGSVVTKDVQDFTIVGGNPAKLLKIYDKETKSWVRV